jgi:nitrite reductase (NO-forming)
MSQIGNRAPYLPAAHVRWALVGAIMTLGLLAACSPSSEPTGNVASGAAPPGAVEVAAVDYSFNPDVLRVPAGKEVTIEITNEDDAAHDFAIDSLGLNTGTIEPGKSGSATFTVPAKTVEYVCSFHPGMEGRIEPQ